MADRGHGASPTDVLVKGRTGSTRQIVFGGSDSMWLIDGAPLDVFAGDSDDRSPWQFLTVLQPGALVAGSSRTVRHRLTGHLQAGCTVRQLSLDDFSASDGRGGLDHRTLVEGVDDALDALHRVIPLDDEPLSATPLLDGTTVLRAGEFVRCPAGVRWISIGEGLVRPGRVGGHRDREVGEFFVAVGGDWICAVTDCRILTRSTQELLAAGELERYLLRHHEAYLRAVDDWVDHHRAEQDRWMSARATTMAQMVDRADGRLLGVVVPDSEPASTDPDPGVVEAAQAACELVADAVGVEFRLTAPVPVNEEGDPVLRVARAARLPARPVVLPPRWWRRDLGPLVGYLGPGRQPAALLQTRFGYVADDAVSGRRRVTPALAAQLQPDAVMLYRKLPDTPMNGWRLMWFALRGTRADQVRLFSGGLLAFLLGLGIPVVTGQVLGAFVPEGRADLIVQACLGVLVASVVAAGLTTLSSVAMVRLEGRLDATLQAAVWYRLLGLPLTFHLRSSTGELASAAMGVTTIRAVLSGVANSIFTALMVALANLGLMFWYDAELGLFAVVLVIVHTAVFMTIRLRLVSGQRRLLDREYKLSDQVFQMLRGLPKLRVAAAEDFAYARWATSFARNQDLAAQFKRSQGMVLAFDVIYVPAGSLLLYAVLSGPANGTLTIAGFITFIAAFTAVLSSMAQVTTAVANGGIVGPIFDKLKAVLQETPEVMASNTAPVRLSGDIVVTDLSFRYEYDAPLVLRDVSFRIRAGEFVAVVGATGCGKSTLMRLLIGFNEPTAGAIRYDGVSLAQLDVAEVRRQCGIVTQHATPSAGTVLANICGPGTYTTDEAWEAARMAALDEDLLTMPLGMQTLLSDGAPELSGGQRQRLMIAQALIRRPRILFFDEATSALDNVTQARVADSTSSLSVTRVVVAHRLSTIMNADRVIVMDEGRIVESGSPLELLVDGNGLFAELVERQRR